ncbi:MAG: YceI family protein [Cyclobacteriaceae bacterium]|nr:YceI family protein [Cyclobacteriaceae bacterium]
MKKINVLVALLFVAGVATAQTTWKVDKAHSKLGFAITHLLISEVEGQFNSFDATITATGEDFSDAAIELTADISSIDTNNESRDKHLRSADFFDVEKFATLSFKSTSFKKTAEKTYKVTGDLTLHGVTKPVTMDITLIGTTTGRDGKKIAGFKATGTLNRIDFGVGKSGPSAGDEVTITAKGEFKAQQ